MEQIELKTDFSEQEKTDLEAFASSGYPGIANIRESDIFSWFALYMEDRSYREIAKIANADFILVLYVAKKFDWFGKKNDYFNEVQSRIAERMVKNKLKAVDFLCSFSGCMHKLYGTKINKALMTNDLKILETFDPKIMSIYFKSLESLEKLTAAPKTKEGQSHSVNININGDTTIKKVDDDTLVMTPGKDYEKMLEEMVEAQENLEKEGSS